MTVNRWSLDHLVEWIGATALIVLFVPMGLYLTHTVSSLSRRSLAEQARTLAETVAGQIVDPLLVEDDLAVHAVLRRTVSSSSDVRYLCVENARGEVLSHTFDGGFPPALAGVWGTGAGGTVDFRSNEGSFVDVCAGILSGQIGTLHVGMSLTRAAAASRRLMWTMGAALAGALCVVFMGAHIVAARVSGPLRELETAVAVFPERTAGGGGLNVLGTREVRSLAEGFSDMVARLDAMERERTATQERMVHAERLAALGELAAGLAHEVNNPLDGMQEAVRYLRSDLQISDRAAKYYPMMAEGLERISNVMQQMLSFARSGLKVELRAYRVENILESTRLLVEAHLDGRRVHLTWDSAHQCVCVCDRHGLSQAVLNLVLNAAEASEESDHPEVGLEARCDDRWVYIFVNDSGPGVPENLRERVFDPFVSTKPVGKGTGLGLSVSRHLIRAGGGDIELATGPGPLGGAQFMIRLSKASCSEAIDGENAYANPDR